MTEIIEGIGRFIAAVGWPIAFGAFACVVFWRALVWLDKQWDKREVKIEALNVKIEAVSNGQRQSLERRLDETAEVLKASNTLQGQTNEALTKVAAAMDSWSRVIQFCKYRTETTEEELDARAVEKVRKRHDRKPKE